MKWQNYFCDDVMRHKCPSRRNSCKLYWQITGTFWSYDISWLGLRPIVWLFELKLT
jgi:hypothetical protein